MDEPAVLVRITVGRLPTWVIATGSMDRWGLLSDRGGNSEEWRREGAHLARTTDQAVRARLIRARRQRLVAHLPTVAWQPDGLVEAFSRVPSGLSVEAAAACLWWYHQRHAGAAPQAASMLLNLSLGVSSAPQFSVGEDNMLRWAKAEVVYTAGRAATRAARRRA